MKRITLSILLLLCSSLVFAQPYIEEIREFKKLDSLHAPQKKANLFIGSSSFRIWKTMQSDFAGYPVVNRAFGGSTFPDLIRYVDDVVFPYNPKQVLIYCGDNDLASSDTVSAALVAARFKQLFGMIRSKLKKVPVVFVSIKPSPSRERLMPKMVEANRLIREFLATQKHTKYIDIYSLMLTPDGKPRKELFGPDMLHMNEKGYAIWRKAIAPVLRK